jgi:hypothetical protein
MFTSDVNKERSRGSFHQVKLVSRSLRTQQRAYLVPPGALRSKSEDRTNCEPFGSKSMSMFHP